MKKFVLAMAIFASQFAFMEPEHSTLEAKATPKPDGVELAFKVAPKSGMKLTQDGPWEITLTDAVGLGFVGDQLKVDAKAYDHELPGFKIKASKLTKSDGTVSYKLRAFVCTEDKTRCFPELHHGKLSWQAK